MVCILEFPFMWILSEEIGIYMATVSPLFLDLADEQQHLQMKENKISKSMLGVDFAIYFLELL